MAAAIEGLGGVEVFAGIIAPGNTATVLIVVAIISLLFFFQRFGTKVVGFAFGPIMFVWFGMLLMLGLSHLVRTPHVLASLNPMYAVDLLTRYPGGFWLLGAVFLCTTGAEGLYNDMGHCGRRNIQSTWIFVKTALVCNYMGQGAWLLEHQGMLLEGRNPFYEVMPQWFLLTGVGIATLAAIVACQAVISGSFTLINEAITLNFWPRVKVKFPTVVRGQIYIPSVNWLLWAGCVGVMFYFRSSGNMEAAYGFFIVVAMLMTTVLLFGYLRFMAGIGHKLALLLQGLAQLRGHVIESISRCVKRRSPLPRTRLSFTRMRVHRPRSIPCSLHCEAAKVFSRLWGRWGVAKPCCAASFLKPCRLNV